MLARSVLAALLIAFAAPLGVARADGSEAIQSAPVSLARAIEIAERQANGRAVTAEFNADGAGQFEVKVLSADKLLKVELDGATGQVREIENQAVEKFFSLITPEQLAAAPTTLAQAIGVAEQRAGGKAVEAEVETDDKRIRYKVDVGRPDGSTRHVVVDGATGQVTAER